MAITGTYELLKSVLALITLAVSAYTDIKERNIYIFPLIIAGVAGIAVSIMIFMNSPLTVGIQKLMSDIIFPIVVGIFAVAVTYMIREYIGEGDGYLFAALGLMIGVITNIRLICISVILSGIFCFVILCLGLGKKLKTIPFAPFYLLGFIIYQFI